MHPAGPPEQVVFGGSDPTGTPDTSGSRGTVATARADRRAGSGSNRRDSQAWHDAPSSWPSPRLPRRSFPRPRRRPRRTSRSNDFVTPVTLSWTPGRRRRRRPCSERPEPARRRPWRVRPRSRPPPPSPGFADSFTDIAGRGTFCYYIQNDALGVRQHRAGGRRHGRSDGDDRRDAVRARRTSCAARSTSRRRAPTPARASPRACCTPGASAPARPAPGIPAAWVTTGVADGTYDVCNVVTDVADAHARLPPSRSSSTTPFRPAPSSLPRRERSWRAPRSGSRPTRSMPPPASATCSGAGTGDDGRRGTTSALPSPPQPVAGRASGTPSTVAVGHARPTAPSRSRLSSPTTAGNVLTITTPAVVDNTAPDVKAVLTAPPAVAGSPTLIWTPAHDAVGITRYDVLRGGNVIGTVASIAGCADVLLQRQERARPGDVDLHRARVRRRRPLRRLQRRARARRLDGRERAAKSLTARDADVRGARAHLAGAERVRRQPLRRLPRRAARRLDAGRRRATFTDATATEGTHDYAVLARDAARPAGRALELVQGRLRQDRADERRRADRAGARERTGQPGLAGRGRCALRRRRLRRAPHERRDAAGRRRRRHRGVRAGRSPAASTRRRPPGTWSYGVFARDAAGNVALIGTVSNVVVVDKTPPLAPTKLTVTRAEGQGEVETSITLTLRWVKPTAADLDRVVVVLNLKRAPVGPADGKAVYHGLGTLGQGQAAARGRTATSRSTPTTTAATTRPSRCARS